MVEHGQACRPLGLLPRRPGPLPGLSMKLLSKGWLTSLGATRELCTWES